ncbi:MAG: hypothetical protein K2X34_01915 [Hyphomonadaceae bacterium]|nr:hypothetical protein [Hyphomonadaceae bacterium]
MPIENPRGDFRQAHNGRLYSTLWIGDVLYATGYAILRFDGDAERTPMIGTVFSFEPDGDLKPEGALIWGGAGEIRRIGVDLFPSQPLVPPVSPPHARRAVRLDATTFYLGVFPNNDHQWIPFGVFAAETVWDIRQVLVSSGASIYDLVARDGELFALGNKALTDGTFEVSVLRLNTERTAFSPLFRFPAPTFARSFAYFEGAWYFGLGAEVESGMDSARLPAAVGEVLRVGPSFSDDNAAFNSER